MYFKLPKEVMKLYQDFGLFMITNCLLLPNILWIRMGKKRLLLSKFLQILLVLKVINKKSKRRFLDFANKFLWIRKYVCLKILIKLLYKAINIFDGRIYESIMGCQMIDTEFYLSLFIYLYIYFIYWQITYKKRMI